jgi:hypothetical protein
MLRNLLALGRSFWRCAAWPARAQERLVLGFPSAPLTVQFAYLAFGEELGFFRDENIKPEYSLVTGSAVLFPQIATGRVDIGLPNPDFLVIAAAKGEPLPVRFVMNWFRSHGFEFVVLDKSPVRQLSDLKGRSSASARSPSATPRSRGPCWRASGVGWGARHRGVCPSASAQPLGGGSKPAKSARSTCSSRRHGHGARRHPDPAPRAAGALPVQSSPTDGPPATT